ncbi:MAG TPA: ergothioneine biosynthesis glutamate--cysteine ligase EgtA [Aldersonia sp.]
MAVTTVTLESTRLTSRAAAEAYLGGVCFKIGPPELVGAELEWLTYRADADCREPNRPALTAFAAALGPHAPTSVDPAALGLPLTHGSLVSIEPGGQIEISSLPCPDPDELCRRLCADARQLRDLLDAQEIRVVAAAADPARRAARILQLPRYRTMERHFTAIGPLGVLMMCNTAATQVSVDAGADPADVAARWHLLHAVGPALLAAFACSPDLSGAPDGAWSSQRMRTWLHLDPARTAAPIDANGYARWALDVPLLCIRRTDSAEWTAPAGATFADWLDGGLDDVVDRRPTRADLDYHLTTLFPPVRATGHLEVRYIDAQPGDGWSVPIHAVASLTSTSCVADEARGIAADTAGAWLEAARHGLADPDLRVAATDLLALAAAHAPSPGAADQLGAAAHRCRRRRTPIEEAA